MLIATLVTNFTIYLTRLHNLVKAATEHDPVRGVGRARREILSVDNRHAASLLSGLQFGRGSS